MGVTQGMQDTPFCIKAELSSAISRKMQQQQEAPAAGGAGRGSLDYTGRYFYKMCNVHIKGRHHKYCNQGISSNNCLLTKSANKSFLSSGELRRGNTFRACFRLDLS